MQIKISREMSDVLILPGKIPKNYAWKEDITRNTKRIPDAYKLFQNLPVS
jgi:hypothetical protein